jgi:transcriptional regulator of acetoin/glycerol metabolism
LRRNNDICIVEISQGERTTGFSLAAKCSASEHLACVGDSTSGFARLRCVGSFNKLEATSSLDLAPRMTARSMNTQGLPSHLFFHTPEQRAALARQQFFEEGIRPSGLVSEAVVQSWDRCRSLGHRNSKMPAIDPVSRSTLNAALSRNQDLIQAANLELRQLEVSLSGTQCRVLLTDEKGVIVHTTSGINDAGQELLEKASRQGVNLTEGRLGTNAPGIVVQSGQPCTVLSGEHYYDLFQDLRCAAAPIRDVHGQLAGVLDLSTQSHAFGFDAPAIVGLFATAIERRLLIAQSREMLVLHFQASPTLLGTPMEGLAGVDTHGKVIWINGTGRSLLGHKEALPTDVDNLLGVDFRSLLGLCGAPSAHLRHLPNGLGIWLRTVLQRSDGLPALHANGHAVPAPLSSLGGAQTAVFEGEAPSLATPAIEEAPVDSEACTAAPQNSSPSLAGVQQRAIEETLRLQGGNVAKTARLLGVSRGLVYRHLRKAV